VLVTSRPPHRFLFMLCHRRSQVFGNWFPEARILPISIDKGEDIAELFSHWESRDLSTLPRAQKSDFGVIVLRAIPEVIRGKSFIVIDIIVSSDGYYLALEAIERITLFLPFISYQLALLVIYLFMLLLLLLILLHPLLSFLIWQTGKHLDMLPALMTFFAGVTSLLNLLIIKSFLSRRARSDSALSS